MMIETSINVIAFIAWILILTIWFVIFSVVELAKSSLFWMVFSVFMIIWVTFGG